MSVSKVSSSAYSSAHFIRVGIIGSRGIPNRYGGFERFIEQLVAHPSWNDGEFRFVVYGEGSPAEFNAVTSTRYVPIRKSEYPLQYCGRAAQMAARECDIVLALGVGISFSSILLRLNHRPLIVNPDGAEWKRSKWSPLGRLVLRMLYYPALLFADRIVIDAESLRADFPKVFQHKMTYIAYHAVQPITDPDVDGERVLANLGIDGPFMLVIARLEPENYIKMIADAFVETGCQEQSLIIVGPTTTPYFNETLRNLMSSNVRFVGGIFNQSTLNVLRTRCSAYVHGHSVGGTNPSLLEALVSVKGRLFCHDNKYNREVAGERTQYFGSAHELSALMRATPVNPPTRSVIYDDERFRPSHIAAKYRELFRELYAVRWRGNSAEKPLALQSVRRETGKE